MVGRPSAKLRGHLESLSPGMGPPNLDIFMVSLGPLPKNSRPNPVSFQFLAGGRLTQVLHLPPPPHLKALATSINDMISCYDFCSQIKVSRDYQHYQQE